MKKKVLFLSPLPPPYYGSAISSEMCLKILSNDSRFEVKNIKLNYSRRISDIDKIDLIKIFGTICVSLRILKFIAVFKPEIIYFMPGLTGLALFRDYFFLGLIKVLKKGTLILHLRTQIRNEDWQNLIVRFLIKRILKADKIIVLGPELIANLNSTVIEAKIFTLANAIPETVSGKDYKNILNIRKSNTYLNILFISNMLEAKGWFILLKTCKMLKDNNIMYKCNFVGEWPSHKERHKFQNYVNSNRLEGFIKHHGRLIGHEKHELFAYSDIMVFPTEYKLETFGRVIIEAMEYGLPVISTNIGTIPSIIIDNETGFILKENTPSEIFSCIQKLQGRSLREQMGLKGRERFLEEYTLNKYKDKFISIFTPES